GFAKELAPSIADWRAAISTNRVAKGNNPLGPDFQKSLDQQRNKLEASAKRLLAKAAELKLDFARAQITAKPKPLRVLGSARYLDPVRRLCPERGGSGAEGQSLAPDRKDPMGAIPGRRPGRESGCGTGFRKLRGRARHSATRRHRARYRVCPRSECSNKRKAHVPNAELLGCVCGGKFSCSRTLVCSTP